MSTKLLLIEDEVILARNLCIYLERQGLEVQIAHSGEAGLECLDSFAPEVVLLDYNLPGIDGLTVLERIMARRPTTRVIMLTGSGSETVAVAALKGGAADYLKKPMEMSALWLGIERVMERRRHDDLPLGLRSASARRVMDSMERRRRTDPPVEQQTAWAGTLVAQGAGASTPVTTAPVAGALGALLGESAPMQTLKALVAKILQADAQCAEGQCPAVLITGETGTGKELVAQALHHDGCRKAGPFVELNCAGIPANLLETELFGYERGAFTDARQPKAGLIESAEGGTLFLDEVGDLDSAAQAKLLKVIEDRRVRRLGGVADRPVDVRFLAATSRDLEKMVRDGLFRADLYYRLRMIRVRMPALRERRGDVRLLAEHFVRQFSARYGKGALRLSSATLALLDRQLWAGNVRELKNTIEQAVVLADGQEISPDDLCLQADEPGIAHEPSPAVAESAMAPALPAMDEGMSLPMIERELLIKALREAGANVSKAARVLGISRDTLRYRSKKYNISI